VLGVEDWIYFHVPSVQDGQLIEALRHDLTYLLACKLEAGRAGAVRAITGFSCSRSLRCALTEGQARL
jgi:hypothetical protein